VSVPLIFATPFPGWETKTVILVMGAALITANWLLMLRSKAILRTIGPVPLQLFGAVFSVLQVALGLQFLLDAWAML
jgi:small neutral amino acid transporter SnatA (MarC family)